MKSLHVFISAVLITSILFSVCSVQQKSTPLLAASQKRITELPIIIIDPGHGGFDGGASTRNGVPEKDINLSISIFLNEYLTAMGFKTILTRDKDVSLENDGLNTIRAKKKSDIYNRMGIMAQQEDAIFLSIHQNHYSEEKYNGLQVFYSKNFSDKSSALAQRIQENTAELLQKNNTRQIKECGSSVYLIYNAQKPACLIECGFLSNEAESKLLQTEKYQRKLACCIALSVYEFYLIKE